MLLRSREEFCPGTLSALLADIIASLLFLPSSPVETAVTCAQQPERIGFPLGGIR